VASPVLGWEKEVDDKVEDIMAELWVEWLGAGCGGVAGRAHRSVAELAENDGGGNGRIWFSGRHV